MLLVSFIRDTVIMEGEITLPLTMKTEPQYSTVLLIFMVIQVPSAYNAILDDLDLIS